MVCLTQTNYFDRLRKIVISLGCYPMALNKLVTAWEEITEGFESLENQFLKFKSICFNYLLDRRRSAMDWIDYSVIFSLPFPQLKE